MSGRATLLVFAALVFEPAACVAAGWVVMGPVQDASFGIPLVFPVESNHIAFAQGVDAGGQIDVVCDEESLSGRHFEDKPLVTAPVAIISEEADHPPFALHLHVASTCLKGPRHLIVVGRRGRSVNSRGQRAGSPGESLPGKNHGSNDSQADQYLLQGLILWGHTPPVTPRLGLRCHLSPIF